jgi:hypothetical protein
MNQNFRDYVRHLSKQDRKTLSQKVLKVGEEFGELAKVALPFDNAYATTHRFTERESILEEAVDTVLCALSVAYDLDFSDEEIDAMLVRKSEKWALLQSKEHDIKYPLPYEIHVTVRSDQTSFPKDWIDLFRLTCQNLNVKPIVLDLQDAGGLTTMIDVMTSSKHFGDNCSAYLESKRIATGLRDSGYDVVRVKIETVPWHPAAPVADQPMPQDCYFEAHIPVNVSTLQSHQLQEHVVTLNNPNLHVSRNAFKRDIQTGMMTVMLTLRHRTGTYISFKQQLDQIIEQISMFTLGKVITEFSIYDTKISHDNKWIMS